MASPGNGCHVRERERREKKKEGEKEEDRKNIVGHKYDPRKISRDSFWYAKWEERTQCVHTIHWERTYFFPPLLFQPPYSASLHMHGNFHLSFSLNFSLLLSEFLSPSLWVSLSLSLSFFLFFSLILSPPLHLTESFRFLFIIKIRDTRHTSVLVSCQAVVLIFWNHYWPECFSFQFLVRIESLDREREREKDEEKRRSERAVGQTVSLCYFFFLPWSVRWSEGENKFPLLGLPGARKELW